MYCEERRDSSHPKVVDGSSEQVDGLLGGECWVEWEHTSAIPGIPRDCRAGGLAERERYLPLRMPVEAEGRQWSTSNPINLAVPCHAQMHTLIVHAT